MGQPSTVNVRWDKAMNGMDGMDGIDGTLWCLDESDNGFRMTWGIHISVNVNTSLCILFVDRILRIIHRVISFSFSFSFLFHCDVTTMPSTIQCLEQRKNVFPTCPSSTSTPSLRYDAYLYTCYKTTKISHLHSLVVMPKSALSRACLHILDALG